MKFFHHLTPPKIVGMLLLLLLNPVPLVMAQPEATRAAQEKKDAAKRAELAKMGIIIRGPRYFPREWEWTKEPWTGSDKPFVALRLEIDRLRRQLKTSKDEQEMIARFQMKAQQQPLNAQSQFAWAYAAVLSLRPGSPIERELGREVTLALATASSPHTYQYDRARYLVLRSWGLWPPLKPLGLRLFKRNPNDYPVKSRLVSLLAFGTAAERQQAVIYGQQLVQSQPNRAGAHGTLGDAYMEIFFRERNANAGRKAISSFRKALALNPSSKKRRDLTYLVGLIEKELSKIGG